MLKNNTATVTGGRAVKNENTAPNPDRPYVEGTGSVQWSIYGVVITEGCHFHDS